MLRRWGRRLFDRFELGFMALYVRLWHGWSPPRPAPLPPTGPAIVIANHQSHVDPALLLASCGRPLSFLQARECYEAIWRPLFRLGGCIPVTRGRADFSAVRAALARLKEGGAVALFPEGEISPVGPGQIAPGKTGAALLALRSGAPVYPVRIDGGPQSRSQVRSWVVPTRGVRVLFGSPVDLSEYRGRAINHRLLEEVTRRLMQAIVGLTEFSGRPRGGASGNAPPRGRPLNVGVVRGDA
jgi:1-acyl-sn-glycerol-3-phosphate acyltransferase